MGDGTAFCSDDVRSVSYTTHRSARIVWYSSASVHGQDRHTSREEKGMDISLFRIRPMEHFHNLLGMQCNCRWRYLRDTCQLTSDVPDIRSFQMEQEKIHGFIAICLPDGCMDSMGKILF